MLLHKSSLVFNNSERLNPSVDLRLMYSNRVAGTFMGKQLFNLLSEYKGYIDKINNSHKWDNAKKLSNNFELIGCNWEKSISAVKPMSRSYYKMLELVLDFDLIDNKINNFVYGAVAEGPGGFVECFIKYRRTFFLGRNDRIQCMTLRSTSSDVPNWNKAYDMFNRNSVYITYGQDGTGNLYLTDNLKEYRRLIGGNRAHLVTADGGFDYSTNFNCQEQQSLQLIFCEIVCALGSNRTGGHFILKVFDTFTKITMKLIYLLTYFYESVVLSKPHTSRPANSERYVVCKNFRGITQDQLDNLYTICEEWNVMNKKNLYPIDILGINPPDHFYQRINQYNYKMTRDQISSILKTILFINFSFQPNDIRHIKQTQSVYALEWCKKYDSPINHGCIYLK
jgi:cap1 methyltransferase